MAPLSAPRYRTSQLHGDHAVVARVKLPVKAATKIWQGSLVCIDAGYAAPARTATGLIILGRALQTVDNTGGAAGAKVIEVERGTFKWENSASSDLIAQADVGKICYAVDDQTVALTSATNSRSIAGLILQVEPDGVLVETIGTPYYAT